jgi:hypothetical protein
MSDLQETIRNYRAGQLDRTTAHARFLAAGWDAGDVDAVLNNQNYTPVGDKAQQFIADQERARRQQPNPLLQK